MAWLVSCGLFATRALDALFPRRKALAELRARWGKPGAKDDWYAGEYFDLVRDTARAPQVDAKTWADLEFPELFTRINATVTPVGAQVLFRRMHEYVGDADVLADRSALYVALQADPALRDALQRRLLPLAAEPHARIADFLFGTVPPPLRHPWFLRGFALGSIVALLVALAAWPWVIWVWFAIVLINIAIRVRIGFTGRTLRDMRALRACLHLVKVADSLGALRKRYPACTPLADLCAEAPQRARLSKGLGWWMMWSAWAQIFPIMIPVTFLNFLFQVDLVLYVSAMRKFARRRQELAASFEQVGWVDAALAVASWLSARPQWCIPVLTDHAALDVRDGAHPLLDHGVANSLQLDRRSVLVTGSNMAGKTTFIKMLGVNAILGQTLGFCLASAASLPRARVLASIHTAHSVSSGKSHYFAEIETIRGFLAQQADAACTILVIDELFNGTNTVERVAIAQAVLEALGRKALVLATTHDVELQALLGDAYRLCHFQEDPAVDGFFDYRLRPGPATARNAIRLLGELKYPPAIIANAMRYAGAAAAASAAPDAANVRSLH